MAHEGLSSKLQTQQCSNPKKEIDGCNTAYSLHIHTTRIISQQVPVGAVKGLKIVEEAAAALECCGAAAGCRPQAHSGKPWLDGCTLLEGKSHHTHRLNHTR